MAIRIIKHGSKREFSQTCDWCGTAIGYSAEDTFSCDRKKYIRCPVCTSEVEAFFLEDYEEVADEAACRVEMLEQENRALRQTLSNVHEKLVRNLKVEPEELEQWIPF